jgi:hypothetical protein
MIKLTQKTVNVIGFIGTCISLIGISSLFPILSLEWGIMIISSIVFLVFALLAWRFSETK